MDLPCDAANLPEIGTRRRTSSGVQGVDSTLPGHGTPFSGGKYAGDPARKVCSIIPYLYHYQLITLISMRIIVPLSIALAPLLFAHSVYGQTSTIVDWYTSADSMTQYPPVDQQLAMADKKVGKYYVTFVGVKGQPEVLVVAITAQQVKDVKSISLVVDFDGINPKITGISTWGYVFDRNRDGKADYLALLAGATAYEGDDFPEDFPVGKGLLNREHQEYFISHAKLIFDHWADDNYDGKLDAAVVNDLDSLRDLVMRQIVLRSTAFNYSFDDVWAFRSKINGTRETVPHSSKQIPYRTIGRGADVITRSSFQEKDAILDLINRAAKQLKLTEENFYHPEDRE